jgi:hypothetical protein
MENERTGVAITAFTCDKIVTGLLIIKRNTEDLSYIIEKVTVNSVIKMFSEPTLSFPPVLSHIASFRFSHNLCGICCITLDMINSFR